MQHQSQDGVFDLLLFESLGTLEAVGFLQESLVHFLSYILGLECCSVARLIRLSWEYKGEAELYQYLYGLDIRKMCRQVILKNLSTVAGLLT